MTTGLIGNSGESSKGILAPGVKFDLESAGQPAQDFPRRSVEHRDVEQVAGWL